MILQTCLVVLRTVNFKNCWQQWRLTSYIFAQQLSSIHNKINLLQPSRCTKYGESKVNSNIEIDFIQMELSSRRANGSRVPDPERLNQSHWDELVKLKTKTARKKYCSYLYRKEKLNEKKRVKRKQLHESESKKNPPQEIPMDNSHFRFLVNPTMFLPIRKSSMNLWHNNKLTQAMQFGDKLIFDCSYDQHMISREAADTARQLTYCFSENRRHNQPFDLYFCNANYNSDTMKYLRQNIPTINNVEFPLNLYEGSYLDLFAKEKLVYLTPHCETDLIDYDSDSIYIIGAIVDKVDRQPISIRKAKELGLRMARLPLHKYMKWGSGSCKSLTLNQMTCIMLDLKTTGDWKHALRHVPRRKIANELIETRSS